MQQLTLRNVRFYFWYSIADGMLINLYFIMRLILTPPRYHVHATVVLTISYEVGHGYFVFVSFSGLGREPLGITIQRQVERGSRKSRYNLHGLPSGVP